MIIQLDKYRKSSSEYAGETYESRRLFGNTVPKLSIRDIQYEALRSAGPRLPENFEGVNAREIIMDAYVLATQI
ncbi:MAG TPA: hypothetical protein VK642_11955 [Burkholderiales bacterium]|nr:hypothetical protein [Burkholderiales bacterium]